ncbi:MarR family winged helix-turn-helix transcriptional regulator [Cytobacillus purgationiresistens]|uniref:DNA-binding MarR family transcriptional regulator n=1 Tax=Cytobacillus purgationiresistens TaxID=863449 RepID=A0ABU0AJV7_9BACI|nr:MarR family transcriptional regulator [Cytobacillus purgationiresistens]MDQ0271546.1 DNA-binding MarR family transcriptional regulator [Cytobacillus purgationiresistens]
MNQHSELFHSINQTSRHYSKLLNEKLVPLGLYAAQWSIIFLLKRDGALSQKEISLYLGVEAPTMTRTLIRMEKSGWINRATGNDKREKMIQLTAASDNEYPKWINAVREAEEATLENVNEEEINGFLNTMKKLKNNLE